MLSQGSWGRALSSPAQPRRQLNLIIILQPVLPTWLPTALHSFSQRSILSLKMRSFLSLLAIVGPAIATVPEDYSPPPASYSVIPTSSSSSSSSPPGYPTGSSSPPVYSTSSSSPPVYTVSTPSSPGYTVSTPSSPGYTVSTPSSPGYTTIPTSSVPSSSSPGYNTVPTSSSRGSSTVSTSSPPVYSTIPSGSCAASTVTSTSVSVSTKVETSTAYNTTTLWATTTIYNNATVTQTKTSMSTTTCTVTTTTTATTKVPTVVPTTQTQKETERTTATVSSVSTYKTTQISTSITTFVTTSYITTSVPYTVNHTITSWRTTSYPVYITTTKSVPYTITTATPTTVRTTQVSTEISTRPTTITSVSISTSISRTTSTYTTTTSLSGSIATVTSTRVQSSTISVPYTITQVSTRPTTIVHSDFDIDFHLPCDFGAHDDDLDFWVLDNYHPNQHSLFDHQCTYTPDPKRNACMAFEGSICKLHFWDAHGLDAYGNMAIIYLNTANFSSSTPSLKQSPPSPYQLRRRSPLRLQWLLALPRFRFPGDDFWPDADGHIHFCIDLDVGFLRNIDLHYYDLDFGYTHDGDFDADIRYDLELPRDPDRHFGLGVDLHLGFAIDLAHCKHDIYFGHAYNGDFDADICHHLQLPDYGLRPDSDCPRPDFDNHFDEHQYQFEYNHHPREYDNDDCPWCYSSGHHDTPGEHDYIDNLVDDKLHDYDDGDLDPIDVTATRLAYPGEVITSTTFLPTVTLDVYTDRANGRSLSQSLYTAPLPAPTQTITWDYEGVVLTYPTVYAAYRTFSAFSVRAIASECVTSTSILNLPQPTEVSKLVLDESSISNPAVVPPAVVSYLNAQPTVLEQLGRPIGAGACDPIVGSVNPGGASTGRPTTYIATQAAQASTTTRFIAAPESQVQDSTVVQTETPAAPSQGVVTSRTTAPVGSNTPQPVTVVETETPSNLAPSSAGPTNTIRTTLPQSTASGSSSNTPASSGPGSSAPIPSGVSTTSIRSSLSAPAPAPIGSSSRVTTSGVASGTGALPPTSSGPELFPGGAGKVGLGGVEAWLLGAAGIGLGML
ncbi:hypothetical protein DM02DRAFT_662102 [Periconia macrospinosa]|uniref:Uncharacterized protein n=1 Tax=Periconia macrospinosa TaxID=97972 RepID=A0A2V1D5P4_9PLEO|nr:hypothetical protein DM02DRAFT_662102 [Periconia macrospinosa]